MKKSTVIPALLLVYLAVMSAIGFPGLINGELSPTYYLGVITVTLAAIWLLRRNILARERRREQREQSDAKRHTTTAP